MSLLLQKASRETLEGISAARMLPWGVISILVHVNGGCSDNLPRTIEVQGKVTYNGAPLENGTVSFVPLTSGGGSTLRPASGSIQPDGSYRMKTFGEKDGVLPGNYAIAIASFNSFGLPEKPGDKLDYAVPERYVRPETSGLTIEIPPDADDTLRRDFELTDTGRTDAGASGSAPRAVP